VFQYILMFRVEFDVTAVMLAVVISAVSRQKKQTTCRIETFLNVMLTYDMHKTVSVNVFFSYSLLL